MQAEPRLMNCFTLYFNEELIKFNPISKLSFKNFSFFKLFSNMPPTLPAQLTTISTLFFLNQESTVDWLNKSKDFLLQSITLSFFFLNNL